MKKRIQAMVFITGMLMAGSALTAQTEVKRTDEEANRRLVMDFYDRFFNRHETREAAKVVA